MQIRAQHIVLNFIMEKRWRPIRHLLLLLPVAISLWPPIDSSFLQNQDVENATVLVTRLKEVGIIIFFCCVVIIYFNLFVLVPRYLLKNKLFQYTLGSLIISTLYYLVEFYTTHYFSKGFEQYFVISDHSVIAYIRSIFVPLIFLSGTSGFMIFKKWIIDAQHLSALKEAHIQEELNHLKSQINPHFLFNTLNNLHALVHSNQEKASKVILGLSDILRYHLYETKNEKVSLKKDIDILIQLLELEKIRRDHFEFTVGVDSNLSGLLIQPFVFINFVENAIKHSLDNLKPSFIHLTFEKVNTKLCFTCKNSKTSLQGTHNKGGIGLQNIQRRLELMFSSNYLLNIQDLQNEYSISLILPI